MYIDVYFHLCWLALQRQTKISAISTLTSAASLIRVTPCTNLCFQAETFFRCTVLMMNIQFHAIRFTNIVSYMNQHNGSTGMIKIFWWWCHILRWYCPSYASGNVSPGVRVWYITHLNELISARSSCTFLQYIHACMRKDRPAESVGPRTESLVPCCHASVHSPRSPIGTVSPWVHFSISIMVCYMPATTCMPSSWYRCQDAAHVGTAWSRSGRPIVVPWWVNLSTNMWATVGRRVVRDWYVLVRSTWDYFTNQIKHILALSLTNCQTETVFLYTAQTLPYYHDEVRVVTRRVYCVCGVAQTLCDRGVFPPSKIILNVYFWLSTSIRCHRGRALPLPSPPRERGETVCFRLAHAILNFGRVSSMVHDKIQSLNIFV